MMGYSPTFFFIHVCDNFLVNESSMLLTVTRRVDAVSPVPRRAMYVYKATVELNLLIIMAKTHQHWSCSFEC